MSRNGFGGDGWRRKHPPPETDATVAQDPRPVFLSLERHANSDASAAEKPCKCRRTLGAIPGQLTVASKGGTAVAVELTPIVKELFELALVLCLDLASEISPQVTRVPESRARAIATGRRDSNQQRLQLSQMRSILSQIEAEGVPLLSVAVSEMRLESRSQIGREADIVESITGIQCVNPVTSSDVLPDDVLVRLEQIARDMLKVMGHDSGSSLARHSDTVKEGATLVCAKL
jgi:hypothetical protein